MTFAKKSRVQNPWPRGPQYASKCERSQTQHPWLEDESNGYAHEGNQDWSRMTPLIRQNSQGPVQPTGNIVG